MPRGIHLTKIHLGLIWDHRVILERSSAQIFCDVFQNDPNLVSFIYLNRLCKACDSGLEVARFQGNRAKRSGGPKFIVDDIATGFFLDIFRREKQVRLKIARETFVNDYYGPGAVGPSIRTVGRVLKKCDFTRKVMQRVHHLRAAYMENVAPFHNSLTLLKNICFSILNLFNIHFSTHSYLLKFVSTVSLDTILFSLILLLTIFVIRQYTIYEYSRFKGHKLLYYVFFYS